MPPIRQWAARGGALALLCGASPCESFLASHVACAPEWGRCSGRSVRQRADLCMSTVSPPLAASATGGVPSTSSAAGEETTGGNPGADAGTERRWINDMKAGEKVIGYVADTTTFAAFVEVGVVRQGSKGKVMPVTGFLHQSEIKQPYALEGTGRAKSCEIEVKKGIHLTAYVKDVFPNAGRLTLSLDPSMNKDKVLKMREYKRQKSRTQRRERLAEKGGLPKVGDVVEGYVRKVRETLLLVDVKFGQLSVLRVGKIRDSQGGGSFINLAEKAKPGDTITVRIEDIESSKKKGADDDKAVVGFVGWGGLDAQENKEEAEEVDSVPVVGDSDGVDVERVPPVESDVEKHRGEAGEDEAEAETEENDT